MAQESCARIDGGYPAETLERARGKQSAFSLFGRERKRESPGGKSQRSKDDPVVYDKT